MVTAKEMKPMAITSSSAASQSWCWRTRTIPPRAVLIFIIVSIGSICLSLTALIAADGETRDRVHALLSCKSGWSKEACVGLSGGELGASGEGGAGGAWASRAGRAGEGAGGAAGHSQGHTGGEDALTQGTCFAAAKAINPAAWKDAYDFVGSYANVSSGCVMASAGPYVNKVHWVTHSKGMVAHAEWKPVAGNVEENGEHAAVAGEKTANAPAEAAGDATRGSVSSTAGSRSKGATSSQTAPNRAPEKITSTTKKGAKSDVVANARLRIPSSGLWSWSGSKWEVAAPALAPTLDPKTTEAGPPLPCSHHFNEANLNSMDKPCQRHAPKCMGYLPGHRLGVCGGAPSLEAHKPTNSGKKASEKLPLSWTRVKLQGPKGPPGGHQCSKNYNTGTGADIACPEFVPVCRGYIHGASFGVCRSSKADEHCQTDYGGNYSANAHRTACPPDRPVCYLGPHTGRGQFSNAAAAGVCVTPNTLFAPIVNPPTLPPRDPGPNPGCHIQRLSTIAGIPPVHCSKQSFAWRIMMVLVCVCTCSGLGGVSVVEGCQCY